MFHLSIMGHDDLLELCTEQMVGVCSQPACQCSMELALLETAAAQTPQLRVGHHTHTVTVLLLYFLTRKTTVVSDMCTVQWGMNLATPLALDVCDKSHGESLCNNSICWEIKGLGTTLCYQDCRWIIDKSPLSLWRIPSYIFPQLNSF